MIGTDCLNWNVFAPQYESVMGKDHLTADEIVLIEKESFTLSDDNAEDFYYFLDHYLFQIATVKATLENIQHDFGDASAVFFSCMGVMQNHFQQAKDQGEVKVSFEEWNKFLSIAYGSFDGSPDVFLVHTYLSIFSKLLAYAVLSHDDRIDEKEMRGIIQGDIFEKFNIENFVEHDFYHWVADESNFKALKPAFRRIAQQIARYDLNQVNEDILKGIYQELIDLETRHALGEYYTPDWLCEKIVDHCEIKQHHMILDPACGSGSFLRAVVDNFKEKFPNKPVEEIIDQVVGIDIHPLSVQISKTTLLLSLGKNLKRLKYPVQLRIYLANTLFVPVGTVNLFEDECQMVIDHEAFKVSTHLFDDGQLFDTAIRVCDELAHASMRKPDESPDTLAKSLRRHLPASNLAPKTVDDFYKIYVRLKQVKEANRDSIWKFILQNSYKPFFLQKKVRFRHR